MHQIFISVAGAHETELFFFQEGQVAFFSCPQCSHAQEAPDAYVGRTAKCLKCGAQGVVTKWKAKVSPAVSSVPPTTHPQAAAAPMKMAGAPSTIPLSRTHGRVIIGLLAAMLMAQIFGMTSTRSASTQWEYTVVSPRDLNLDQEFERLGRSGWELVFARRASDRDDNSMNYEMIFKRPVR